MAQLIRSGISVLSSLNENEPDAELYVWKQFFQYDLDEVRKSYDEVRRSYGVPQD